MKIFTTKVVETFFSIKTFLKINQKGQRFCTHDGEFVKSQFRYEGWNGEMDLDPLQYEFFNEDFYIQRVKWLCFFGFKLWPSKEKTIRCQSHDIIQHCALGDKLDYSHVWIEAGLNS